MKLAAQLAEAAWCIKTDELETCARYIEVVVRAWARPYFLGPRAELEYQIVIEHLDGLVPRPAATPALPGKTRIRRTKRGARRAS